MVLGLSVCFLACLQLRAGAQDNMTNRPVNAETKAVVTELLEVAGARRTMETVMSTMLDNLKKQSPQLPDDYFEEIRKGFSYDSLLPALIPVYARHWSLEDLKGMVAFYKTPLGQRMVQETPKVMQESMALGGQRAAVILERLSAKIQADKEERKAAEGASAVRQQ